MRGCTANGDLNDAQYSRPLPWIGLYVAAASFFCAAAMGWDAYSGFRRRKVWFPTRLFSLNATTLTLLGVATKFPVDLNTGMPRREDQLTKLSGTVLICTVMGNLMPSLGTMDDSDVVSNVVALAILVVTVIVNIGIQMGTGVIYVFLPEHAVVMLLMLVLLVIFASSALAAATTKELLETQYNSKYEQASEDDSVGDKYSLPKLKTCVKRFWLMAHTCSPQYVMGRSATCTASGAFCLLAAGTLAEALFRSLIKGSNLKFCSGTSDYEWSSTLVLVTQAATVFIGTIAPAYRWFSAVGFRSPEEGIIWSSKGEFKVEGYWVQRLNEWKEAPLPFQISRRRARKGAHDLKNLAMSVLIGLQVVVVLVSKLVRLASILPVRGLHHTSRLFKKLEKLPSSVSDDNAGLADYVLYLEGERDLVDLIMRSERRDTEKWIEKGKREQPQTLLALIMNYSTLSEGFKGVYAFENDRITSLVPEEPPNCWALPVVTLVSIAVALPDINQSLVKSLMRGVSEGLKYVRLIEKYLDAKGLVNMREGAERVWLGVDLYSRWLDLDLHSQANKNKNWKEIIEVMQDNAKKYVLKFMNKSKSDGEANLSPLEWPEKVLAANCMYRVCSTILQEYGQNDQTELFIWLQSTISDIFGACFTNIPKVIHMECICCPAEKREESVRTAAFLLGEAEKILKILENTEVACFFPIDKVYIDNWRDRQQTSPARLQSFSSNKMSSVASDELSLLID